MDAEGWIRDYYRCLDKKDIDASIGYWWPDAVLRFADAEPAVGQQAVRAALTAMVNSVASTTHRPLDFWELPNGVVVFEARVDFVRLDAREVTVAGIAFCQVDGERFLEQRVLVDIAPVYATGTASVVKVGF
jgi:SnoaL-like domain